MKSELDRLRENPELAELKYAATDRFSRIDFTAQPARIAKKYRRGRAELLDAGGWSDNTHAEHAAASRIIEKAFKARRKLFARQLTLVHEDMAREGRVLDEAERIEIRNEALAEVARRKLASREPLASRLLTVADLEALPEPRWLVAGIIPLGGLVFLVGPSGVGKTAVVQSQAMAVASGRKWLGRKTIQGRVLVIVGEGQTGIAKRVRAEMIAWGGDEPAIDFLFAQPDLGDDAQADELVQLVAERQYIFVIADTLNRLAGDRDENSASAMAGVIRNASRIAAAGTETTFLFVHHHGKAGTMRGSSALYASADTVLTLEGEPGYLTLTASKQKDHEGGRIGEFRLATSAKHNSIHVEGILPGSGAPSGAKASRIEESLAYFVSAFAETGATRAQFTEHLIEVMGVQKSAANNYVGALIKDGRLRAETRARGSFYLTLAPTLTTFDK